MIETEHDDAPIVDSHSAVDGSDDTPKAVEAKRSDAKPQSSKKKKKPKYIDDGHTVYSMTGLDEARGIKRRNDKIKLSRSERWALIKAAFARYTPIFLMVIGCFSLTALLLYFWLK